MRLLLDTHAFLWWVADDPRLPERARAVIAAGDNEIFFSAASAWEIAIKAGLGRVEVPEPLAEFINGQLYANSFEALPVHLRHAAAVATLPDVHKDPFYRMLLAQAIQEGLTLVSGDEQVAGYGVEVVW